MMVLVLFQHRCRKITLIPSAQPQSSLASSKVIPAKQTTKLQTNETYYRSIAVGIPVEF